MIRDATFDDVPAIARLVNRAYRIEEFFVHGDRTDEDEIRDMLGRGGFLVLEDEGAMTGCVYLETTQPRGYFGMLSVDPDVQGGGRGRELIAAVEERCRAAGCGDLDILVVDLRTELPPFYQRLGFAPVGTEPWGEEHYGRLKMPAHFVRYRKALA